MDIKKKKKKSTFSQLWKLALSIYVHASFDFSGHITYPGSLPRLQLGIGEQRAKSFCLFNDKFEIY